MYIWPQDCCQIQKWTISDHKVQSYLLWQTFYYLDKHDEKSTRTTLLLNTSGRVDFLRPADLYTDKYDIHSNIYLFLTIWKNNCIVIMRLHIDKTHVHILSTHMYSSKVISARLKDNCPSPKKWPSQSIHKSVAPLLKSLNKKTNPL